MPDFLDPHVHLWDLSTGRYPWLREEDSRTTSWIGDYAPIRRTYQLGDLESAAADVPLAGLVHVEALHGGEDPSEETRWVAAILSDWPHPFGIVGRADLRSSSAAALLDAHQQTPQFRGIRMAEMGGLVDEAWFRRGFGELSRRGLAYDLNVHADEADAALDLARTFPDTRILVDNMANPGSLEAGELEAWRASMARLAQAPNVAVKISGLGMADHSWTVDRIRPWVLAAIEIFGVNRSLFASNWPVDSLYGSYGGLFRAYASIVAGWSSAERASLFGGNARAWYRL